MANFFFFMQLQQQQEKLARRKKILQALSSPLFFRDWLKRFEPTDDIGRRGLGDAEPILKFLHDLTGLSCDLLNNETLHVYSVESNISLPAWVIKYLAKVTENGNKYGDSVTSKDCLDSLE